MSDKYTYADVIIDPNDPRVEIGAKYYWADIAYDVLKSANKDGGTGILEKVLHNSDLPFVIKTACDCACLIRKKEYTENDIITDVSDPRLKDAIGKTVYVAHKLYGSIVDNANNNDSANKGVLVNLGYDPSHPFEVHTELGLHWDRIILSKNQPPRKKYVPFDFDDPEVRKELMGKTIVNNYGLDGEGEFREAMIVGFENKSDEDSDCWSSNGDTDGTIVWTSDSGFHADEFLKKCTFLDGSPCGKLVEENDKRKEIAE